jgi:hypothetical protein
MALMTLASAGAPAADAAPLPSPAWEIHSVAQPTNFSSAETPECEANPSGREPLSVPCDSYRVLVRNAGSVASSGAVTVSDAVPAGVTVEDVSAVEMQAGIKEPVELECSPAPFPATLTCTDSAPIPPDGVIVMSVNVAAAPGAPETVTNVAAVEGGGASTVVTTEPTTTSNTVNASEPPGFGFADFGFAANGIDGTTDTQAGSHPYEVTASFDFVSKRYRSTVEGVKYAPIQEPKNVVVYLPPGLVGNPQDAEHCPPASLQTTLGTSGCPTASIVGTVTFDTKGEFRTTGVSELVTSAIYNLTPDAGYPAEFGFTYLNVPIFMYASLVHIDGRYELRVASTGLPEEKINGVSLAFFGNLAEKDGTSVSPEAFFTNPTRCDTGGPLKARIEANSWDDPGHWVSGEVVTYPQVTGCDMLQFEPTFKFQPETLQADSPSGYEAALRVPQASNLVGTVATPDLRTAEVTLPEGVAISPSAADGLEGCQETGPNGIELPGRDAGAAAVGDGEAVGADGLPRLLPGHCPPKSVIGTVKITTPLLSAPLDGHAYLAAPRCGAAEQPACTEASAANGDLFSIYLEAEGSGAVIKLKGQVAANPNTGQITAKFVDNPQLPVSEVSLQLSGGPRASLANPQTCSQATTSTDLSPWSAPETPDATPSSSFNVDWDGNGGACPATPPFGPFFTAGTVTPSGGGFSPFTLTFSRQDREQGLGGIIVRTPPGLLGKIAEVPLCGEPQASRGTCGPPSLIGHTQVAVGAGSHPFWVQGDVFLTGPYEGAPFGLSIVTHAQAGPFNLGNVVVRAAIHVDSHTSALTVSSDPLPQIIDGVPLRIQTVNVTVDRPGFMFNPTNCSQQQITGTVTGALPNGSRGSSVAVSSPFAAGGCKNLPFKPSFTALTQANTSKANGASLHVKLISGPGQANIAKVAVDLPKQLPSRLTTLQKACVDTVFNTNPASCPAGSLVGTATAVTPILKNPLTGPAYLVSHGGAAFPDLVIVLQGEGITLYLDGNTRIKKGITSSTFNSVPDAPISTFDLVLPEGPHSALAANGSLCNATKTVSVRKLLARRVHGRTVHVLRTVKRVVSQLLSMPTALTGQNGAVIRQTTKIAVSGCPKHNAKKRKKAARKHKEGSGTKRK